MKEVHRARGHVSTEKGILLKLMCGLCLGFSQNEGIHTRRRRVIKNSIRSRYIESNCYRTRDNTLLDDKTRSMKLRPSTTIQSVDLETNVDGNAANGNKALETVRAANWSSRTSSTSSTDTSDRVAVETDSGADVFNSDVDESESLDGIGR
jgi:hypothetical protein